MRVKVAWIVRKLAMTRLTKLCGPQNRSFKFLTFEIFFELLRVLRQENHEHDSGFSIYEITAN